MKAYHHEPGISTGVFVSMAPYCGDASPLWELLVCVDNDFAHARTETFGGHKACAKEYVRIVKAFAKLARAIPLRK